MNHKNNNNNKIFNDMQKECTFNIFKSKQTINDDRINTNKHVDVMLFTLFSNYYYYYYNNYI